MLYKSVSYAKTITSLVNQGKSRQALTLFTQLQKAGSTTITEFILSSALRACGRIAAIAQGKQLHCFVTKNGYHQDSVLTTSLLDMYCKCDRVEQARQVFDEMPLRDVVAMNSMISGLCWSRLTPEAVKMFDEMPERNVDSWNSIISGLGHGSEGRAGLSFFERMRSEGVGPDGLTMVSVLSICADLAALLDGKQVHGLVVRFGHELYLPVGNAIIDMYAKCGDICGAALCFETMPTKNVVSWTALIEGYAKQGLGTEALRAFDAMESEGLVAPNEVTFLGALHACSHSGLVQQGYRVFNTMTQKYSITPRIEHYTCVVDLLARAGRLEEAWGFVEAMPVEPDAELLTALLSSCCRHGDGLGLARQVGEKVLELGPRDSGAYVLISNLYGLVGDLEGVAKVKMLMSGRGVTKEMACTWVEIRQRS